MLSAIAIDYWWKCYEKTIPSNFISLPRKFQFGPVYRGIIQDYFTNQRKNKSHSCGKSKKSYSTQRKNTGSSLNCVKTRKWNQRRSQNIQNIQTNQTVVWLIF
jgi:hypothetical protein